MYFPYFRFTNLFARVLLAPFLVTNNSKEVAARTYSFDRLASVWFCVNILIVTYRVGSPVEVGVTVNYFLMSKSVKFLEHHIISILFYLLLSKFYPSKWT